MQKYAKEWQCMKVYDFTHIWFDTLDKAMNKKIFREEREGIVFRQLLAYPTLK